MSSIAVSQRAAVGRSAGCWRGPAWILLTGVRTSVERTLFLEFASTPKGAAAGAVYLDYIRYIFIRTYCF